MTNGKFIVLDGPDGSGKTTQTQRLVEILQDQGFKVIKVREPGITEVGEKIRNILMSTTMEPLTELMLFTAARTELINKVILPYLKSGHIVICDRFTDSTYAYQGAGRGIKEEVLKVEELIKALVKPDITFYFHVDLETAKDRCATRSGITDVFESEADSFKQRVRKGYEERAIMNMDTTIPVNGNLTMDEVTSNLLKWFQENFFEQNKHLKDKGDQS